MMSGEVSRVTPSTAQSPTVSPWHSPVPYLFGGLAAMLGLIAFALLILACSYWKHSSNQDNNNGEEIANSNRDLEAGDLDFEEKPKVPKVYEENILVIMAGQAMPTFLATPLTSRASSFGSNWSSTSGESSENMEVVNGNKKIGDCGQVQTGTLETSEDVNRVP